MRWSRRRVAFASLATAIFVLGPAIGSFFRAFDLGHSDGQPEEPLIPPATPTRTGLRGSTQAHSRKPSRRGWIIPLVTIIVVIGAVGIGTAYIKKNGAVSSSHLIIYRIVGSTNRANTVTMRDPIVTMRYPSGGIQEALDVAVPYARRVTARTGDFVYLSAQNAQDTGAITCSIEEAGRVIATQTSSGPYVIATCQAVA